MSTLQYKFIIIFTFDKINLFFSLGIFLNKHFRYNIFRKYFVNY